MVYVVVLNWNGASDTLACLDSLTHQTYRDMHIVVVDNGSEDDSVERIKRWIAANPAAEVTLIEAGENLGFAAGSNVGIRSAMKADADLVLLLNNDTVVEPEGVAVMAKFLVEHSDCCAVTAQIRYADRPVVWNCGGDLTWFGSRKYLYGDLPVERVPQSGWRRITFITGCAAMVRASVFAAHGLLTERFFFGEEDYEFSLRMKRAGCGFACCLDAVIHHKVGTSVDKAAAPGALGRYYVYYLNRFIDMRDQYPRPLWWLWRLAWVAVAMPRLKRSRGFSWGAVSLLGRRLLRDSARLDGVSRERFEAASRSGLDSL